MRRLISMSAVVALSVCTLAGRAAAASVPVTFEEPDNLEFGDAPLASSSTFGLSWDFDNSGSETIRAFIQIDAFPQASIVPSSSGHAINTKGTGATNGRFTFTSTTPGTTARVLKTKTKSNQSNDRIVEVEVQVGDNNGVDFSTLLLEILITLPSGLEHHGDPHVDDDDDWSITITPDIELPMGGTIDPGLPDVTYTLSAVAVIPAPASAALLGLGGLVAMRRRR